MKRWIIALLLFSCLAMRAIVVAQQEPPAVDTQNKKPTTADVQLAIKELGHANFRVRQAATARLWSFGRHAEQALKDASKSEDLEVAKRAADLFGKVRYGIKPDTPREVVSQIRIFRDGDQRAKYTIVNELIKSNRLEMLTRLMRNVEDETQLQYLANTISYQTRRLVGSLKDDDDDAFQQLEELLKILAESDAVAGTQIKHYAAFLMHTGKLDQRVRELLAATKKTRETIKAAAADAADQDIDDEEATAISIPKKRTLRILAFLLTFQGNAEQALAVAEQAEDFKLQMALNIKLKRWSAFENPALLPGRTPQENVAFETCIHRLAGNKALEDKAFENIGLQADAKSNGWTAAEAFMLGGRWKEAYEIFKLSTPSQTYETMVYQGRIEEALAFAEIPDPLKIDLLQWFIKRTAKLATTSKDFTEQYALGLAVVRTFAEMGLFSEAEPLLKRLVLLAQQEKRGGDRLPRLVITEFALRKDKLAYGHLADALAKQSNLRMLSYLLGDKYSTHPQFWIKVLEKDWAVADKATRIKDMLKILKPARSSKLSMSFAELAKAGQAYAKAQSSGRTRVRYLDYVAFTCANHDEHNLAITILKAILESNDTGSSTVARERASVAYLLKLGESYFAKEDWKNASECFQKTRKVDPGQVTATYMAGYCLAKTGQEKEGQRLMDRANLMPLGSGSLRYEHVKKLDAYELEDEARKQRELVLDIPLTDWAVGDAYSIRYAAASLGDAIHKTEPARAAELWQHYLMHFLTNNARFIHARSYATLVGKVARARAIAAAKAGNEQQFAELLWQAHDARLRDTELAIDVFESDPKIGKMPGFQRVFDDLYNKYDVLCKRFPKSASYRNHLAWMSVSCKQKYNEALTYSKQSVELEPENSAYIDTLSAIYFELEEFDLAIKYQEQALAIRPTYQYFKDQIAKFKKAKAEKTAKP